MFWGTQIPWDTRLGSIAPFFFHSLHFSRHSGYFFFKVRNTLFPLSHLIRATFLRSGNHANTYIAQPKADIQQWVSAFFTIQNRVGSPSHVTWVSYIQPIQKKERRSKCPNTSCAIPLTLRLRQWWWNRLIRIGTERMTMKLLCGSSLHQRNPSVPAKTTQHINEPRR